MPDQQLETTATPTVTDDNENIAAQGNADDTPISNSQVTNTATIDGNGNITVQGNAGPVTINVTEGVVDQGQLDQLGISVEQLKQLLIAEMMNSGRLQTGLDQLRKHFPESGKMAELLSVGSRNFHNRLKGSGGRFESLVISEHILSTVIGTERMEGGKRTSSRRGGYPSLLGSLSILQQEMAAMETEDGNAFQKLGPHAFLLGEAGTGKTVSMLYAWNYYLEMVESDNSATIPIYVALSQYNREPRAVQEKFITTYIARHYLGIHTLDNAWETSLLDWLRKPAKVEKGTGRKEPKLLLLLDGLNEITADIAPLLIDLQERWMEDVKDAQIVVSSRYRSKQAFTEKFADLRLNPLSDSCIRSFIQEANNPDLVYPTQSPKLDDLLRNPMMFSLFAKVKTGPSLGSQKMELKPAVNCTGELLWNYMAHEMAKFEENNKTSPDVCARFHFLIQYLVPNIAYEMELSSTLEMTESDLEELINRGFERFYQADFLRNLNSSRPHIRRYRKYLDALKLGKLSLSEEIIRFEKIVEDFRQELFPLTWEGQTLRFQHQSFQDFFAAKHLLNEIQLSNETGSLPLTLKDRLLPENIRILLGEITGEHYNKPQLVPDVMSWEEYYTPTPLDAALGHCRSVFDQDEIGAMVWNILMVWKEARGTLAGVDFSRLLLEGFDFNQVEVVGSTKSTNDVYSRWDHCRLSPKQFFPQGHSGNITRVRVSPDGQYLATASADRKIKVWLIATKICLHTFEGLYGHRKGVTDIAFSPDSQKIISGGKDGKVIEWSVSSGRCLQVFRGHNYPINAVAYHPSGERILSADKFRTVKEWSAETGKCIRTITSDEGVGGGPALEDGTKVTVPGHGYQVAAYFKEGKAILIGGFGHNMSEWSVDTGELIAEYEEWGVAALAFSPCKKKFLTASLKGGVREWSIAERKIIKPAIVTFEKTAKASVLEAHHPDVMDLTYSPSGKDILVVGKHQDIKEFSIKGETILKEVCHKTQVFEGHAQRVSTVAYHPNGETFFSGSFDDTIKCWSTTTGQVLQTFHPIKSPVNDVLELNTEDAVIIGSADGNLQQWCFNESEIYPHQVFRGDDPVYTMAVLDTATDQLPLIVVGGESGKIQIWNLHGQRVRVFDEHEATISSLDVNQENGMVVSGDHDGKVLLWSLDNEEQSSVSFPQQQGPVTHVCWSKSGGDTFAISARNGTITVWDAENNAEPVKQFHHGSRVYTIAYTGRYLLSGGYDGKTKMGSVKEWAIEEDEPLLWQHELKRKPVIYVAYDPTDDKILCSTHGSFEILEWAIQSSPKRTIDVVSESSYSGHKSPIIVAKYGLKTATLLSASQDSTTRQWNIADRKCLWSIENISGFWVKGLDFSQIRWTEPMTDNEWDLLQQYGAKL